MENVKTAVELYWMNDAGEIPPNTQFRIVGGRTLYNAVGWMWRNSDKQIYLNKFDWHIPGEEKHRRYLKDDTRIELLERIEQ